MSILSFMPHQFKGDYNCTFNPNPNYKTDCIGNSTSSQSSSTRTGAQPGAPPTTPLPNITNSFKLYYNQLPITIPSNVDPLKDSKYTPGEDKNVDTYWIKHSSIPSGGYSDLSVYYDDNGNEHLLTDPTKWTGFNSALSKCIEFDGKNGKPNCYAIAIQSDFSGIRIADSKNGHNFKYNLIELPTISSIQAMDADPRTLNFTRGKKLDPNFLVCQPVYYTWVKTLPTGNYNPYAPGFDSVSLSKSPPSSTSSGTNLICNGERYLGQQLGAPLQPLEIPKNFFDTPAVAIPWGIDRGKALLAMSLPKKIAIGVGICILLGGIYYWYSNYGPGAEDDEPSQSDVSTSSSSIKKTQGGYYYY